MITQKREEVNSLRRRGGIWRKIQTALHDNYITYSKKYSLMTKEFSHSFFTSGCTYCSLVKMSFPARDVLGITRKWTPSEKLIRLQELISFVKVKVDFCPARGTKTSHSRQKIKPVVHLKHCLASEQRHILPEWSDAAVTWLIRRGCRERVNLT